MRTISMRTGLGTVVVALLAGGCRTTELVYTDGEVPRGSVPAVSAAPRGGAAAVPAPLVAASRTASPSAPAMEGRTRDVPVQPKPTRTERFSGFDPGGHAAMAGSAAERFQPLWRAEGSPRVSVLYGRELSDEVREWIVATKQVTLLQRDDVEAAGSDGIVARESYTAVPNPLEPTVREDDRELRTRVERAFMRPLRDLGVETIDRTTLLRQAAASAGNDGRPTAGELDTRTLETTALNAGADILVELIPGEGGRAWMAEATETRTGRILAQTRWLRAADFERYRTVELQTPHLGPDGWSMIGSERTNLVFRPGVDELVGYLADATIAELVRTWEQAADG